MRVKGNLKILLLRENTGITVCILKTSSMGTLASSEDPDEMQHNAAFHQGLHCLLR